MRHGQLLYELGYIDQDLVQEYYFNPNLSLMSSPNAF
jgi:hypothetical protein